MGSKNKIENMTLSRKSQKSTIESYSYEEDGVRLDFSFPMGEEGRKQKIAFVKLLRDAADLLSAEIRDELNKQKT